MSGALTHSAPPRTFGGPATGDVLSSIRRMIALEGAGADAPLGSVDVLRLDSPIDPLPRTDLADAAQSSRVVASRFSGTPDDESALSAETMTATAAPANVKGSDRADVSTEFPVDQDTSILTTIIRDVIRQELGADGSGRIAREMREMVLREVARVLTAPGSSRSA